MRLTSLIAYLRTVMRLPFRQIQQLLLTLYGFAVSLGELVEVLDRLRKHSQTQLHELKGELLESPAIQADETGWREDGINGYIWSVSTPTVRSYEYHHSRAGEVVKQLIGSTYQGCSAAIFMRGTTSTKACINGAGFICCVMPTHSKTTFPLMRGCWPGSKP